MLNYTGADIDIFFNKAEGKLADLGAELLALYERKGEEGLLESCLPLEVITLSEIIEAATFDATEAGELVSYALSKYNLADIPLSPFMVVQNIINTGTGTSGIPYHTHPTSQITNLTTFVTNIVNSLIQEPVWQNSTPTTDKTGALIPGSNLAGLTALEIIDRMVNSYQYPAFTAFTQNRTATLEVGQEISGGVTFGWAINNPANVKNASDSGSLTVSEAGVLTPTGTFNLFGLSGKDLTFTAPYKKNLPGTLTVTLNGLNSKSEAMNTLATSFNWLARIYYFNSTSPTATALVVATGDSLLSPNRNVQFTIAGSGYKYIFIPDAIAQSGISFLDPVNGNIGIDFETPVNLTVTNPQGLSLAGKLYRTTNNLGSALTVKIL